MKILVTAGGTIVPIDRVRSITNVSTGITGARIALEAFNRAHDVVLLTSSVASATSAGNGQLPTGQGWELKEYRTFDELQRLMEENLRAGPFDAVVHSAAVSDYMCAGIYAPAPSVNFQPDADGLHSSGPAKLLDRAAGKIKSDEPELWLRLVRSPKLIDRIRTTWKFTGLIVKFKLETSVSDRELLDRAEQSRVHSQADLMVANTLEHKSDWAYIGARDERYDRIAREELPAYLIAWLERLQRERANG